MTCRDIEGWRAISRLRDFDTTPCFEEGLLLPFLLVTILLISTSRSSLLISKGQLERTPKSTQVLKAKLALLAISVASSVVNLVRVQTLHKHVAVLGLYILEPLVLSSILVFTFYNHTRTRRSSTSLLLFWPVYVAAIATWLRTFLAANVHPDLTLVTLKLFTTITGSLAYGFECMGSEIGLPQPEKLFKVNPELVANIYSIWTFSWMNPLMSKGASQIITEEDLPPLRESDESANLGADLHRAMQKRSLWKALFVAYGGPFAFAAGLKVIQDLLAYLLPQLLRWLLSYISKYQGSRFNAGGRPSKAEGFTIALIMFVATVVQRLCLNQYLKRTFECGMRVRAGLITAIYSKALILSNDGRSRATGDIVNLMSVDATRLQDFCAYGLMSISGPFQILLASISLYDLLGWAAFVGITIMILSIPLNTFIARVLKRMQEQQMKHRDKRTRLMSEILSSIRTIKLFAWENTFIRRVFEVRNDQELKMLRKIGVVTAWNMALWTGIPFLVAFSSLAAAALLSTKPLTSDIIFPAVSLFMLLQFPLSMFAQVTSNLIESIVSIQRLSAYFAADELQSDARVLINKPSLHIGDEILSIQDADFSWSKNNTEPTLEGIDLSIRKGELVGLLGRVGAGKSSLLSAIIGGMIRREGDVTVYGSVAYAPQNPWILSASIRDNIMFSHEYDEDFYDKVIEGCALGPDLALMPNGDLTEVGEKGITLSGGQRARVALGRAVYARADLTLLDDCLAAVDSHVARHIFDHVIGPNGLLSAKARILVTNNISFIKHFDSLIYVRRGIILEYGSYHHLASNPNSEIAKLVRGHQTGSSGANTPVAEGTMTPESGQSELEVSTLNDETPIPAEKSIYRNSFQNARLVSSVHLHLQSAALSKEHQEQGRVKVEVYTQYIQAASKFGFVLFLLITVAQQALSVFATLVLRYWGEHNRKVGGNDGRLEYLLVYGGFSFGSSLLGALSAIILWVYCALRSARHLHDSMLQALMHAPLSFFETTPTGRILNLFSRDTYVVDQTLARVIHILCRSLASCLSIVIVIGYSFPLFLLSVLPLGWFYLRVMRYYMATSRELKRIDAVTRSPIVAWFSETLAGLSTIHAFDQQSIFLVGNQRRIDHNQLCYFPSISANRWLAVRLELVGALIIFMVASLAVLALFTRGVDAGLVGLVLSYALNTTSTVNWVVRSASEVEQNIISVERILHQIQEKPEAPYEIPHMKPTDAWPSKGVIEFKSYSTRYRSDLVLKDISIKIDSGQKIGICGRTGAGKSSLLLALFRIIEPVSGSIFIDSVDITKVGLYDLRSILAIVPQNAELFEGTLRENIDPVGLYSDIDIWNTLDQVHLKGYVETLPEKLDTFVREAGLSLSGGQCQLLCLARALLQKLKILVLDEATSAVDLDTDQAIQDIIRGPQFRDTTIITIAHRLNTIMDYDKILLLDSATVAEFESPTTLVANPNSLFFSLVKESGMVL